MEINTSAGDASKKSKRNKKRKNKISDVSIETAQDNAKINELSLTKKSKKKEIILEITNPVEISISQNEKHMFSESFSEDVKEQEILTFKNKENCKKEKRKKKEKLQNLDNIPDIDPTKRKKENDFSELNSLKSKEKSKSGKNIKFEEEEVREKEEELVPISSKRRKQKVPKIEKRENVDVQESNLTTKKHNKKVTFDVPDVVMKDSQKLKYMGEEESAVKDEDIDKFCDELNEEDNKQYENWVKLFEENFRPKKKKT